MLYRDPRNPLKPLELPQGVSNGFQGVRAPIEKRNPMSISLNPSLLGWEGKQRFADMNIDICYVFLIHKRPGSELNIRSFLIYRKLRK